MTYHVGDTAPPLSGKLTSDGQPVNLTGADVKVHVRQPDRAVLTLTAAAGTDGAWSAPWPAPVGQEGKHEIEVQVTYSGGGVQTFGPQQFYVKPQIA